MSEESYSFKQWSYVAPPKETNECSQSFSLSFSMKSKSRREKKLQKHPCESERSEVKREKSKGGFNRLPRLLCSLSSRKRLKDSVSFSKSDEIIPQEKGDQALKQSRNDSLLHERLKRVKDMHLIKFILLQGRYC